MGTMESVNPNLLKTDSLIGMAKQTRN